MATLAALKRCQHLISPAHLAHSDTNGKWKAPAHLRAINNALVRAWTEPNSRTAINVPFQHGKSWLGSVYFPAWVLLLWPETRIALASYEEGFAAKFGGQVRDIVKKYGPALGIHIRQDTDAKGEWVIDGHGGGMVCKGRGGALVGRPADLLILDDLIKNAEEAQSPTILEGIWDWYSTVAYSRLGPTAPVIGIGTRWGPEDIFGKWIKEGKQNGDQFEFIVFQAIAEEDDILGREPGEALWPERVPLKRLEKIARTNPRWFRACWQGKPVEGEGLHFQPRLWPKYIEAGDAWRIYAGLRWLHYRKVDCTILHALDWAQAGKKKSNKTAIVTAALTEDGKVLFLNVLNRNLRYEENAPALADICELYGEFEGVPMQQIAAGDDDMLSTAMVTDCRRYGWIPEVKRMPISGKAKILRAQAGIIRSQNGLFYVPDWQNGIKPSWWEDFADQLSAFTGEEGAEDDMADATGILGRLADEFKPDEDREDEDPEYIGGYDDSLFG